MEHVARVKSRDKEVIQSWTLFIHSLCFYTCTTTTRGCADGRDGSAKGHVRRPLGVVVVDLAVAGAVGESEH
jgi:hypothetical protein